MVPLYSAIGFLGFVLQFHLNSRRSKALDRIIVTALCLLLIVISGVRFETGGDFFSNWRTWERISGLSFNQVLIEVDPGAALLRWVVGRFTDNAQWFFAFCAVVIVGSVGVFVVRFSTEPRMSMFLFLGSGLYFASHNITIQFVAVAVWLWSVPYLLKRDLAGFVVIGLLAATIHPSTLLLMPLFWLSGREMNGRIAIMYVVLTVVSVAGARPLLDFIQRFVYDTYVDGAYGMAPADPLGLVFPVCLLVLMMLASLVSRESFEDDVVASSGTASSSDGSVRLSNLTRHALLSSLVFSFVGVTNFLIVTRISMQFLLVACLLIPNMLFAAPKRWKSLLSMLAVLMAGLHYAARNALGDFTPTPYVPFWRANEGG